MQNKPNLLDALMNVSSLITADYENIDNCKLGENKPNTKPIQTQSNPISPPHAAKQSQFKPKQTQFQRQKNAAGGCSKAGIRILIFAFPLRPIFYAQKKANLL